MSALFDYVFELRRRRELLSAADSWDEHCMTPGPPHYGGDNRRRHWTRQDRNRYEYHWALEESEATGTPRESIDREYEQRRCGTRVYRILKMLPDIVTWQKAAMAEVLRSPLAVSAPLIIKAAAAHRQLIDYYKGYREWQDDDTLLCVGNVHNDAVEELAQYVTEFAPSATGQDSAPAVVHPPTPTVALPNEARDKWLYEHGLKGVAWKLIKAELAKLTDWEPIESIPGLRFAATRYQVAHCLPPIPKRKRGRKSRPK